MSQYNSESDDLSLCLCVCLSVFVCVCVCICRLQYRWVAESGERDALHVHGGGHVCGLRVSSLRGGWGRVLSRLSAGRSNRQGMDQYTVRFGPLILYPSYTHINKHM
jgi:hypothetical protein